ncbi:MAG TPA: energy transducer TonB [Terracidiphilus sp.]|jgi:TonB family protein
MRSAQIQGQAQTAEKIGPNVRPPVPIETPPAELPSEALAMGINGICLASIVVDVNGNPNSVRIVRCTNPLFEKNAMAAVTKYKFRPAVRITDGSPVSAKMNIELSFRRTDVPFDADELWAPLLIRYSFLPPPGMASTGPDSAGVFPLSRLTTKPELTSFDSHAIGGLIRSFKDGFDCQVTITINANGKAADPDAAGCDKNGASNDVAKFLLNSRYRPAELNGKRVAVRALVHFANIGIRNLNKLDTERSDSSASKP